MSHSSKYVPIIQYKHTMPKIRHFIDRSENVCDFCGDIDVVVELKKDDKLNKYRICSKCLYGVEEETDTEEASSDTDGSDYDE